MGKGSEMILERVNNDNYHALNDYNDRLADIKTIHPLIHTWKCDI